MELFEKAKQAEKNETKRETEYLQAGDFWLLLFVVVVILILVFKFYA